MRRVGGLGGGSEVAAGRGVGRQQKQKAKQKQKHVHEDSDNICTRTRVRRAPWGRKFMRWVGGGRSRGPGGHTGGKAQTMTRINIKIMSTSCA